MKVNDPDPKLTVQDFINDISKRLGFDKSPMVRAMQKQAAERFEQDKAMAACIARLFATKDGERVLDWLMEHTLRQAEIPVELLLEKSQEQILMHAIFRAGENSIVNLIRLAIAQGQQRKAKRRSAVK